MIELQNNNKVKFFSLLFFKLFLLGIVSIMVFTILYNSFFNPFSQNDQNMTVISFSTFRLLRSILLTPLVEEVIFRLGIQNLFKQLSKSNIVAILFTSLIFAFAHNDTMFFPYFFNSIVYGLLYVKSGNLLKMPFSLHMANNFLSVLM